MTAFRAFAEQCSRVVTLAVVGLLATVSAHAGPLLVASSVFAGGWQISEVDPSTMTVTSSFAGGPGDIKGLAADSNGGIFASTNTGTLYHFSSTGQVLGSLAISGQSPVDLAFENGYLYAAYSVFAGGWQIAQIDPNTMSVVTGFFGGPGDVQGLAVAQNGDIYASSNQGAIQRLSLSGQLLGTLSTPGQVPTDLAIRGGVLYAAYSVLAGGWEIDTIDPLTLVSSSLVAGGAGDLRGLAVAPDGTLYASLPNGTVQHLAASGTSLASLSIPGAAPQSLFLIAEGPPVEVPEPPVLALTLFTLLALTKSGRGAADRAPRSLEAPRADA